MFRILLVALLAATTPALAQVKPSQPVAPLNSPKFNGTVQTDKLQILGSGSIGDGSLFCTVAPWSSRCREAAETRLDTINALDGQAPADAGVRDDVAIQAAVNAAAARGGGRVYLPARPNCYVLSAPITVTPTAATYLTTVLYGGGAGTCIKPGVPMESMVVANGRFFRMEGLQLANESNRATNGVKLTCAAGIGNVNNYSVVAKNFFFGFVNGVKNLNCDAWRVEDNWFQNQTGWDVWSADNGVNTRVSRNYSIGSAGNVLYDKIEYAVEGVYVDDNSFLPTEGKGIVIRACLSCYVRGNNVDQANSTGLTLDGNGTNKAIADIGVSDNWFGTKASPTDNNYGIEISGNAVDIRITNTTVNGWKQCGLFMGGGVNSVQNVSISGLRGANNGLGEGTGDICASPGQSGVGPFTVRDSWLLSTAGRSAVEYEGVMGVWENNRLAVTPSKSSKSIWRGNYGDDRDIANGKFTPWPTYTPSLSCGGGALGAGVVVSGGYDRQANRVAVWMRVQIPNATALGTCAGPIFASLPAPVNSTAVAVLSGRENGATGKMVQGYSLGSGASVVAYAYDQSSVALSGADILLNGTYEATP